MCDSRLESLAISLLWKLLLGKIHRWIQRPRTSTKAVFAVLELCLVHKFTILAGDDIDI